MSIRTKLARAIIGKSALSKSDFGDWDSFIAGIGQKKKTGEILWNDYAGQRRQYKGTTYNCINKIAPAVAAVPLHLFIPDGNDVREEKKISVDDDMKAFLLTRPHCKAIMKVSEDVEEITDHAALDIFTRANGAMSRHQTFELLIIDMKLYGNCYWLPIMNQTDSFPAMLQFLPVEKMKPIEKDGITTGYKLKRRAPHRDKIFKLEEIVHFFYPNPHSNGEGFSPVSAGSQWISGEGLIATFQNSTLTNMGIPASVVKILRRMPSDEFNDFKKEFGDLFGGPMKTGKMAFTQGEWQLEKLGQTLAEMGYLEGAKLMREFIANTMGVPISKLTMESSNRAVADVGKTEFQRDTILPDLTMISQEMTESLIPLFPSLVGTGAFYMFSDPVDEDMRNKMLMRRINRTTSVTTPNEERQEDGREPHDSPEADSLAPASALSLTGSPEQQARSAIDTAVDKAIDEMRNGDCHD
jgi:HK97 family phage portal protein